MTWVMSFDGKPITPSNLIPVPDNHNVIDVPDFHDIIDADKHLTVTDVIMSFLFLVFSEEHTMGGTWSC